MNHECADPECLGEGMHLADVRLTDGTRRVPPADAAVIDEARRRLLGRGTAPLRDGPVPEMAIVEIEPPEGPRAVEIHTLIATLDPDTPPNRARLTIALRAGIGDDRLRPTRDHVPGSWCYSIMATTTVDFEALIRTWRVAAGAPGVIYARLDGLCAQGIWVIESRPQTGTGDPFRIILSGVHDDAMREKALASEPRSNL